MCRFLVYLGLPHRPVLMADAVLHPENSIVRQSYECRERFDESFVLPNQLNADGFGVGWYSLGVSPEPTFFTSTLPAWNNKNLWRLSEKVSSTLLFAHVRAATPGSAVTETNCHPFSYGPYLFMHNGGISDFGALKRRIIAELGDRVYAAVEGTTDSEHAFALFLTLLGRLVPGALDAGAPPAPAAALEGAVVATLRALARMRREAGLPEEAPSSLNFAVSNGSAAVVTRYVHHRAREPATMYFSAGTAFRRSPEDGHYRMSQMDRREEAVIVASERLTSVSEDWVLVPKNTMLVVTRSVNVSLKPLRLFAGDDRTHR